MILIPRKKIFQRDYCSLGPSQLQDVNNQSLVQCYSTNVLVNGNDNETTDDTTIKLLDMMIEAADTTMRDY